MGECYHKKCSTIILFVFATSFIPDVLARTRYNNSRIVSYIRGLACFFVVILNEIPIYILTIICISVKSMRRDGFYGICDVDVPGVFNLVV